MQRSTHATRNYNRLVPLSVVITRGRWVLPTMGVRPKGVLFSGLRYMKGYGFHLLKYMIKG